MRSIFTFTIAGLILTACSQTPILPTATPLPSMTPTQIPTVTLTFSPTFTSTPPSHDLTPAAAEVLKNMGPMFTMEQLNNPETIPSADFDYLNSPEFAEAIVYAANHGLLPKHPVTAQPMQYVTLADPSKFDGGGRGDFFTPDLPGSQAKEENRAYVPVYLVNTKINGVDTTIGYISYQNKDKTNGVIGVNVPPYSGGLLKNLKSSLGVGDYGVVLTGKYFKDESSCLNYYDKIYELGSIKAASLCIWTMDNQSDPNFLSVFDRWSDPAVGILSNKIEVNSKIKYYVPIVAGGAKRIVN